MYIIKIIIIFLNKLTFFYNKILVKIFIALNFIIIIIKNIFKLYLFIN